MGRRLVVGALVIVVAVGIGAAVAYVTRDDDSSERASNTSTSSTTSTSTSVPSTTAPATTTAPTTTTEPDRAPLPDPCGVESSTIRLAIDAGVAGAPDAAAVDTCRLAAVDESWAMVHLVAKPGAEFASTYVLLQGGGGAWSIVEQGGSNLGCGRAPQPVLVDLGVLCASTGGDT